MRHASYRRSAGPAHTPTDLTLALLALSADADLDPNPNPITTPTAHALSLRRLTAPAGTRACTGRGLPLHSGRP